MIYKNPKTVFIDDKEYKIRYDMWSILDIIKCFNDYELNNQEKIIISLEIFYLDTNKINNMEKAVERMNWFIDCGNDYSKNKSNKKLMDWEQDFNMIKSPVNKILGYDIGERNIHWWTFMSAYMEIFSNENNLYYNVCNIRQKINKGIKLEKHEKKFYNENRDIIELKNKLTPIQQEEAKKLFGEV